MAGTFPLLALTLTWVVLGVSLLGMGVVVIQLATRSASVSVVQLRQALWVGLLLVTLGALVLDVLAPLGGDIAQWILIAWMGLGLISALWNIAATARHRSSPSTARWWVGGVIVFALLIVYAGWALGEPTNYDTGLYHIGAIDYSRDHPTIPGLANLHERFGFNSSMWPLSAWFGSLGWNGNEFRIVNGVLLTLFVMDTAMRLLGTRRPSVLPGTVIMIGGSVLVLGVVAQYPGRLIASSAQDTAALILGLVATAYFSDAMAHPRWWDRSRARAEVAVAVVAAISCALMRPLGWVLVVGMLAVAVFLAAVRHELARGARALAPVSAVALLAGLTMGVRDYLLSGWLLYPSALIGFPVDWRYPDPSVSSDRITAWARTPFQDVQTTLADSSWIGGWLQRLPTDWSIPALVVLLALATLLWWRSRGSRDHWLARGCAAALAPILFLLAAWFITAPDPRFAWSGIVAAGLVPVAFLSQQVPLTRLLLGSSLALVALIVLASVRGSWEAWSLRPVAPPVAETIDSTLADGTDVVMPTPGDQCWTTYPLCRPQYESRSIEQRGSRLHDGFRPYANASSSS